MNYNSAYLDDKDARIVDGVPVIGKTTERDMIFPDYKLLSVKIENNALREKLYNKEASVGCTFPRLIHPPACVSTHAHVGSGVIELNNTVVRNNVGIGDGCILNPGVEAHHDNTIGNYCLINTNSVLHSLTHVGDRVWIGSTATVATNALVPDDTIIEDVEIYKAR